jgi:hypothetical protein
MVSPMDEDEIRRRRSFEMIARANACLSEPRDLEAKHRAQRWIEEAYKRQQEERAPPPPQKKVLIEPFMTRAHMDAALAQARQQDRKTLEALAEELGAVMGRLAKEAREAQEAHAMTSTRLQVEVMTLRERVEKLEAQLTEEPKAAHPHQLRVIG